MEPLSTFWGFVVSICFMLFVLNIVIPFFVWLSGRSETVKKGIFIIGFFCALSLIKDIFRGKK